MVCMGGWRCFVWEAGSDLYGELVGSDLSGGIDEHFPVAIGAREQTRQTDQLQLPN